MRQRNVSRPPRHMTNPPARLRWYCGAHGKQSHYVAHTTKARPIPWERPNPSKPTTGPLQPQQQEVPHGLQMLRMEHNRVAPGTPTPRHHPWVSQKRTSPASGHTPHAPSRVSWKVSHGSCQLPPYFFLPWGSSPKGRVRREAIGRRLKLSWPSTKLGV